MPLVRPALALLATCAALGANAPAHAAKSYDNCTGFIDSVPATITTQGTWCLRKDLSTNITNGAAISIAANNVTIDCNDFKLGGLAAGNASMAIGIQASGRQNATVRNCNVRGFHFGLALSDGGGHLVEDNRLDNNLYVGISVSGENNRVRRNAVYDTGGFPNYGASSAIDAWADITDNTVSGVFGTYQPINGSYGIIAWAPGSEVRGNRIKGLGIAGSGYSFGILAIWAGIRIEDNHVVTAPATANSYGIFAENGDAVCIGNSVVGAMDAFRAYRSCAHASGNLPAY